MTGRAAGAAIGTVLALFLGLVAAPSLLLAGAQTTCTAPASGTTSSSTGPPTNVPGYNPEQLDNATTIIRIGGELGVPTRGWVIALATALQESALTNVGHGDAAGPDSRGLFQQRAPWGPLAVRMDPAGAARMFFAGGQGGQPGLLDVDRWQALPLAMAAQAVQRSADGSLYAQHEPAANRLVAALAPSTVGQRACGHAPSSCDAGATSNYANGRIPLTALCPLAGAPGHFLRADAAYAFDQLSAAYATRFGTPICVTDSYRTYAEQVRLKAVKPTLAATPGTSNHGWGTATDLCGGIQSFGTPQHAWLLANAPLYSWFLPAWARAGGSKPEPWHWEYAG